MTTTFQYFAPDGTTAVADMDAAKSANGWQYGYEDGVLVTRQRVSAGDTQDEQNVEIAARVKLIGGADGYTSEDALPDSTDEEQIAIVGDSVYRADGDGGWKIDPEFGGTFTNATKNATQPTQAEIDARRKYLNTDDNTIYYGVNSVAEDTWDANRVWTPGDSVIFEGNAYDNIAVTTPGAAFNASQWTLTGPAGGGNGIASDGSQWQQFGGSDAAAEALKLPTSQLGLVATPFAIETLTEPHNLHLNSASQPLLWDVANVEDGTFHLITSTGTADVEITITGANGAFYRNGTASDSMPFTAVDPVGPPVVAVAFHTLKVKAGSSAWVTVTDNGGNRFVNVFGGNESDTEWQTLAITKDEQSVFTIPKAVDSDVAAVSWNGQLVSEFTLNAEATELTITDDDIIEAIETTDVLRVFG